LTSVMLPANLTSIGNYAFRYCASLTSVTIPDGVTSIGNYAFSNCAGLTSVTIPGSVTSIGDGAFRTCTGLTSVTIPNSVTSIGSSAFSGCTGLTSVTIDSGVTSIGNYMFYGCTGLTSVTIPNSVVSIGNSAFDGCTGLTSLAIPQSVTSIGGSAFGGCTGLTNIEIGDGNSVYSSVDGILFDKDETTLVIYPAGRQGGYSIPDNVTTIGQGAFDGVVALTSVTIPNSVTNIGVSVFYACSSLTSVTIPSSVTSIGNGAFNWCTGLTSVTSLTEVPLTIDSSVFNNVPIESVTLYVPEDAVETYRVADVWKNFGTIETKQKNSITTGSHAIPQTKPKEEATVIAPITVLSGEFTAGPNPVAKQSGIVNFYRQGKRVANSELRIYDATGNVINKVKISDKALNSQAKRQVGTWDLKDKSGRPVSEGTYLVKGVVKTSDGKSEKVSVILGVR